PMLGIFDLHESTPSWDPYPNYSWRKSLIWLAKLGFSSLASGKPESSIRTWNIPAKPGKPLRIRGKLFFSRY
ncbi:MAG: hypothetical protein AAF804_11525, partial [Bacteroidota bacterium]